MCSAATWSLKKNKIKRPEACELWFWWKMSKIKWTDKKSNEDVLMDIEEERALMDTITKRKKKWIGHILRGNSLLKLTIEGQMKGSKTIGRPRTGMLDLLKGIGGYTNMKQLAQDRDKWRSWMPQTCPRVEH